MAILHVKVLHGKGKWAYWHEKPVSVVADEIMARNASHFAGQLAQPVWNSPCEAELHTEGFIEERPKSIWAREAESELYGTWDED